MTKLIGVMCVRDEADLLPEVYPHIKELVDEIYVYDDGSTDDTWGLVKDADYAIRREDDINRLSIPRPNYHHLLEKIKENHNIEEEDVWAIITMGDRFFLNKTPRQIVKEAGDYVSVQGIQLDFLRHRRDPWTEENDGFPNYSQSLRELCRAVRVDERCTVAYKVTNETTYQRARYPWPKGAGTPQYSDLGDKISLDMPYLEHQGRRSPKAAQWRYNTGSRPIGRKYQHWDFSTFESSMKSMRRFYEPYRVYPWAGSESLELIIKWYNTEELMNTSSRRWFFKGMEAVWPELPPRTDI
ncbi:hypothetical protein LCGC14_0209220 [marine sediment metagenome]|uniref:Glycosyltransferase 2-like domain-containing protein n=1 Tax=marine sediment metagenome TaxID=412755 RepID=A0A0F9X0Z9_9ZZZZ